MVKTDRRYPCKRFWYAHRRIWLISWRKPWGATTTFEQK